MKKIFISVLLSFMTLATAHADNFVIGYNEGWFGPNYGSDLTNNFNLNYVNKIFDDIRVKGGGTVVRLWLFEGREGLILGQYAPQTQGVNPVLLSNLSLVLKSARERGLQVYLTLWDGNGMPSEPGEIRDYYYNLLNNKFGENTAFNNNVLLPLIRVMEANRDVIYALDLMNEIQAPIFRNYWGFFNKFDGPRVWMRETLSFIKAQASWLKITSSAGWGWAAGDIRAGLFSGLGFDFYDLHVYDNDGDIDYLYDLCDKVRKEGIPILLGEFGQGSKRNDENLQRVSTEKFLKNAKNSCFSGALAWRFDSVESYFAIQRPDGSVRPAADVMRNFK